MLSNARKIDNDAVEVIVKAVDHFMPAHKSWLFKKLYESRDKTGDVVFTFPKDPSDIVIPQPGQDISMLSQDETEIRCHSQVLEAKGAYFQGMFEF